MNAMHLLPFETGWIEMVCGCMFSGKTEELIKRLRRAEIARMKLAVFKPEIDQRYARKKLASHSSLLFDATIVSHSSEILDAVKDEHVVGIDEVQFFDDGIRQVARELANRGKRVICAGLDQDYLGKPFENTIQLMAEAEYVTKLLAICVKCGNPANRTQRKVKGGERIVVGAADIYEARCRKCFDPELRTEGQEATS